MEPILSTKEFIEEVRKDIIERINRSDNLTSQRFNKVDAAQAHTNGDVSRLKLRSAFLTGGLTVVLILVIPLIVYIWNQESIASKQLQTLQEYNQKYE